MIEKNRKITNYLRKTVIAQVDKGIDFKNDDFYKISKESFISGNIDLDITLKLFEKNKKEIQKNSKTDKLENEKHIDENIYVILAAKVIKTEFEGTRKKRRREGRFNRDIFYSGNFK